MRRGGRRTEEQNWSHAAPGPRRLRREGIEIAGAPSLPRCSALAICRRSSPRLRRHTTRLSAAIPATTPWDGALAAVFFACSRKKNESTDEHRSTLIKEKPRPDASDGCDEPATPPASARLFRGGVRLLPNAQVETRVISPGLKTRATAIRGLALISVYLCSSVDSRDCFA
jgi:hypothetical protein